MAVKIRLSRAGAKNNPFFRIVVMDSHARRDGRYLEKLGHYDPHIKEAAKKVVLNKDRYLHWLKQGATPTESVLKLLHHAKVLS